MSEPIHLVFDPKLRPWRMRYWRFRLKMHRERNRLQKEWRHGW